MRKWETRAEYGARQLTDLGINELPTRRGGREQRRGAEAVPTTASAPAGRGSTDDHECNGTDDLFETKTKKAKRVAASTIKRRPKKRPCTPARQPSPPREVSPVPEEEDHHSDMDVPDAQGAETNGTASAEEPADEPAGDRDSFDGFEYECPMDDIQLTYVLAGSKKADDISVLLDLDDPKVINALEIDDKPVETFAQLLVADEFDLYYILRDEFSAAAVLQGKAKAWARRWRSNNDRTGECQQLFWLQPTPKRELLFTSGVAKELLVKVRGGETKFTFVIRLPKPSPEDTRPARGGSTRGGGGGGDRSSQQLVAHRPVGAPPNPDIAIFFRYGGAEQQDVKNGYTQFLTPDSTYGAPSHECVMMRRPTDESLEAWKDALWEACNAHPKISPTLPPKEGAQLFTWSTMKMGRGEAGRRTAHLLQPARSRSDVLPTRTPAELKDPSQAGFPPTCLRVAFADAEEGNSWSPSPAWGDWQLEPQQFEYVPVVEPVAKVLSKNAAAKQMMQYDRARVEKYVEIQCDFWAGCDHATGPDTGRWPLIKAEHKVRCHRHCRDHMRRPYPLRLLTQRCRRRRRW